MSRHRLSAAALGAIVLSAGAVPTMGRTTRRRAEPATDDAPVAPDHHGVKRLAKAEAKRERKKAARRASNLLIIPQ